MKNIIDIINEKYNTNILEESAKTDFINKFGDDRLTLNLMIMNESKADEQNLIDFAGDSLAKRFLSIKSRLKSPENDIYYWLKKTPIELEDRVNEIENAVSKTKQKEIQKIEGAELVAEENGYKVYRIDSYEASCLYGKGTKWCTASTETSSHFNDYKKRGIKFYYFIKNNEKYALALYPKIVDGLEIYGIKSNYEMYDAKDKLIKDFNQIKSLNLPEIPGVKLTFEILPTKIENGVLVKVYPYNQGEFVIPNNVTKIGEFAFSGCTSLTSILIPSSVTEIGDYAFYDCRSLTSITIPNSVTKIGVYAFSNCRSLTSITIPNSVTKIGVYAFYKCLSLTIYAEATSKPAGWDADWNPNNIPVVWNYKNSTGSNNINEAKVDDEYTKFWSMIDRDIFDAISLADPKTQTDSDGIKMIGFVAKQLLLPKYREGEKDFYNDLDKVKEAVKKYESNPGQYAKLPAFKSVAEFIAYMENPAAVVIDDTSKEVDPITKVYNEYYKDIKRDDFDKIIAMDPKTSKKSIGEIAKNLLLVSYRKKENILSREKEIFDSSEEYYNIKDQLPRDKQQLTGYASTNDFIKYVQEGPESSLVSELKETNIVDPYTKRMVKDDFRLIGSTSTYDIIEPLSHLAAVVISGGYGSTGRMSWCTGYAPVPGDDRSFHWRHYTEANGRVICFMHKKRYRGEQNKTVNWQISIRNNEITEFLNGKDEADYPGSSKGERFKNFLMAHIDIFKAIKDKEPFNRLSEISEVDKSAKYASQPLIVDSIKQVAMLERGDLSTSCTEIIFKIEKIPVGICAAFISLTKVSFEEGVKDIGDQAFANCPVLKTVIFPESLEIIGREAFQNCLDLQRSIRIPDNVKEIRTRAFGQNKCKLKLNKERKNKVKFDIKDKEWVATHVQVITINNN